MVTLLGLPPAASATDDNIVEPIMSRPLFTRDEAPLCPSLPDLQQLLSDLVTKHASTTPFDHQCLSAADGWPARLLAERTGAVRWLRVLVTMPQGHRIPFWTLAWRLRNGAATITSVSPPAHRPVITKKAIGGNHRHSQPRHQHHR